jgi:hypothetical protein
MPSAGAIATRPTRTTSVRHSVTFDMTIPESISFRSNLTDAGVPVSLVEDLEDQ